MLSAVQSSPEETLATSSQYANEPPSYALGESSSEAERLRLLDMVYGNTSRALLRRTGLREGWRCADLGCGPGHIALWLAEQVGPAGYVAGLDRAALFVKLARTAATRHRFHHTHFVEADISASPLLAPSFNLVYSRCLLSHLPHPLSALRQMARLAKPGGWLVVEDIDCGTNCSHPESSARRRHLALYQAIVQHHGGDPLLGRKLPRLFRAAGLTDIHVEIVAPTEPLAAVNRLYPLTLAVLKPALVEAGLAMTSEVDALIADLHALAEAPAKAISSCPLVQVWARKAV
jgi:SAM-dependent methyltransferase